MKLKGHTDSPVVAITFPHRLCFSFSLSPDEGRYILFGFMYKCASEMPRTNQTIAGPICNRNLKQTVLVLAYMKLGLGTV